MDVSRLNLKSCALLRRQHGKAQRGSAEDHMLFAFQFANNRCWDAYLTGFTADVAIVALEIDPNGESLRS